MNHRIAFAAFGALLLLAPALAPGQAPAAVPAPEIGIVEKLGETIPLDREFYDEAGNLVTLRSLISKPTILTFVYFRCPGICTPLLTELSHMVEKMDLEPGKDYQIISLSFDHRDDHELASDKKESYLGSIARPVPAQAWRFLTGDSLTVRSVADAAGFYYKRDGNEWVHAGALIVISPEGRITRYINGITYLPFDIKMAVFEAGEGRVSPTIAKVLTFCYSYDPESRTYAFNIVRVSMVVILFLVLVFVLIFLVLPRFKKGTPHGQSS
jgi:protein SCO1/2